MSCNYADGLSPYDHKGVLGLAERFDSPEDVKEKCEELVKYIKDAKHIVIHTGAGISTSAGIPDFRGPKGVWTLEEKGLKPDINVSFSDAVPTKTHMAIKKFIDEGLVQYIVSQNIDGLHLKSGVKREHLAELHGNMFADQCNICKRFFVRSTPTPTVGLKVSNTPCIAKGRPCRGKLQDSILDWEHSLPDDDLDLSDMHSSIADLSICLGTTLQIVPSGNIPLNTLKSGGKLVICNLQPTKHDNKADLIINTYVDTVMEHVANMLGLTIPSYNADDDPTCKSAADVIDWTIKKSQVVSIKSIHRSKCFGVPKKRILAKRPSDFKNSDKPPKEVKKKKKAEKPPKPEKVKKVTKREKAKLKKKSIDDSDSDQNVIVINDEDSDGSDIIFIDEDADDSKAIEKDEKCKLDDVKERNIKPEDQKEIKINNGNALSDTVDKQTVANGFENVKIDVKSIKADVKSKCDIIKEESNVNADESKMNDDEIGVNNKQGLLKHSGEDEENKCDIKKELGAKIDESNKMDVDSNVYEEKEPKERVKLEETSLIKKENTEDNNCDKEHTTETENEKLNSVLISTSEEVKNEDKDKEGDGKIMNDSTLVSGDGHAEKTVECGGT